MKTLLRIIATGLLLIAGLLTGITAYGNLSGTDGVDDTMKRNAEIRIELQDKAKIVDQYIADHGQLPPYDFFDCCTVLSMDNFFPEKEDTNTRPRSNLKKLELTQPFAPTDYVLDYWRGEWFEAYASQTGKMTLPQTHSEYYFTGSRMSDAVLWSLVTLFLFGLSVLAFVWKPKRLLT